jgi:hypothetical protein
MSSVDSASQISRQAIDTALALKVQKLANNFQRQLGDMVKELIEEAVPATAPDKGAVLDLRA